MHGLPSTEPQSSRRTSAWANFRLPAALDEQDVSMEDSTQTPASTLHANDGDGPAPTLMVIAAQGDLCLRVKFISSPKTLKPPKKEARPRPSLPRTSAGAGSPAGPQAPPPPPLTPLQSPRETHWYRVELAALTRQSEYFRVLLGADSRFGEARAVAAVLEALDLDGVDPRDVEDAARLPAVDVTDDDEATRSPLRHHALADLLRILHGAPPAVRHPAVLTMRHVAALAVLADRFGCAQPVSRSLSAELRFKWPATRLKAAADGSGDVSGGVGGPRLDNEEVLRQRVLVAWLLDQPLKLHASTRDLIIHGSRRWTQVADQDEAEGRVGDLASWWDLQDDLEVELRYRRECILNTIASVQHHFISLYSSRTQMCKLGYDSSSACDSFQLGQMIKFLSSKKLLFLVDFSSTSFERVAEFGTTDINHIISLLSQVPSYQVDRHHTNCGLRTKILPILEYIKAMISSNVLSIPRREWKNARATQSWMQSGDDEKQERQPFRFGRSAASDDRLRYEGAMATDRMARQLFTAKSWDWSPEDRIQP
ncbi:hypothetical protein RB601_003955 [Gaeumannomyces tritici]